MVTAQQVVDDAKQWQVDTAAASHRPIQPLSAFQERADQLLNLKNGRVKRYLQWEEQKFGINLGWTDEADPATAARVTRWFCARQAGKSGPVTYGETVALGYGKSPSFIRHAQRSVGINLDWSAAPVLEWVFVGGTAGQPVRTDEWLALYNQHAVDFLVHFDRNAGGDIGWITSSRWEDQITAAVRDAVKTIMNDYARGLVG